MNHECLACADMHGNITHYEKIKDIVRTDHISFVFFGGDLLPKHRGLGYRESIEVQADFIKKYFLNYLQDLSTYAHVFAIFGNDDFKSNYYLVQNINPKVVFLDNQVISLPLVQPELFIAGYPYVSLTPFSLKDWEKWDYRRGRLSYKVFDPEGYLTDNGSYYPKIVDFNSSLRSNIHDDLQELALRSDPQRTIYLMHEPPNNTPLDQLAKDNKYLKDGIIHIGSKAIRRFIKEQQPLFTIHGHIHETFQESGNYVWSMGSSLSVTPANDHTSDYVAYVLFTLPYIGTINRHLV